MSSYTMHNTPLPAAPLYVQSLRPPSRTWVARYDVRQSCRKSGSLLFYISNYAEVTSCLGFATLRSRKFRIRVGISQNELELRCENMREGEKKMEYKMNGNLVEAGPKQPARKVRKIRKTKQYQKLKKFPSSFIRKPLHISLTTTKSTEWT